MHRYTRHTRWLDPAPEARPGTGSDLLLLGLGRFIALAAVAAVALALTSCAGGGRSSAGGGDAGRDLVGTIWRVEHLETPGAGQVPLADPGKYVLQLQPGGRLGIRADCVTCVGVYNLGEGALQMQLDCPGLVGCGPGSQAELFLGSLEQVRTFDLKDDRLRLYNLDNSGVLTMERVLRYSEAGR